MMCGHRHHLMRRGVVTLFAVLMIALVGAALAAVTASVAMEARRTNAAAAEMQLRQGLLAGEAWVLAAMNGANGDAVTPKPGQAWLLPDGAGRVVVTGVMAEGDVPRVVMTLESQLADAVAAQELHLASTGEGGAWRIAERHLVRLR